MASITVSLPDPSVRARMVPFENGLVPSTENRFLSSFQKCCCISEALNAQNREAVQIYKEFLDQRENALKAILAIKITNIDLIEKQVRGQPLYSNEVQSIQNMVERVTLQLPSMKKALNHLAYYQELQTAKQTNSESFSLYNDEHRNNTLISTKSLSSCTIQKSNGSIENFDSKKIEKVLTELPFAFPLDSKVHSDIISHINKRMRTANVGQISSSNIRDYIVAELAHRKLEIVEPAFLDAITSPMLKESILKKRSLEELIGEEGRVLLEHAERATPSSM